MIGYTKASVKEVDNWSTQGLVNVHTTFSHKELNNNWDDTKVYQFDPEENKYYLNGMEVDLNTEAHLRSAVKTYFSNPNTDESLMGLFGLVQTV